MKTLARVDVYEEDGYALLTWWLNYPVEVNGKVLYPAVNLANPVSDIVLATIEPDTWEIEQETQMVDITKEQIDKIKNKGEWTEIIPENGPKMLFPPNLWENDDE